MAEPAALLALAVEAAFGWPRWLYRLVGHPVGFFARIIGLCARRWNQPSYTEMRRRLGGLATVLVLLLVAGGGGWALQAVLLSHAGPWAWPVIAVLAAPGLAQRSLYDHVVAVAKALDAQELPAARKAVSMIVGRDTAALDEADVSRAAIESLAESFCDGVTAPLFLLLVGGLPGIWVYKAINTADSLIGHREAPWGAFGWAAARSDDLLNLVPARIAGALICIGGGGGWRTLWRDAGKHPSPNAGWPEAAMAGALDLRLAGPISYDGAVSDKAWIGDGRGTASATDIRQGLVIYRRACLGLWLIAAAVAWLG